MPSITTPARQLLDICLLRVGPQELPCSWKLFALTLIASLGVGYLAMQAYGSTSSSVPLFAGLLFTLGFIYAILAFRGLKIRLIQTASAIFGTDAILTLVALPVPHAANTGAAQSTLAFLALAGVWIWSLLVLGHILRHALSLSLAGGILVALGYLFGSLSVAQLLHG